MYRHLGQEVSRASINPDLFLITLVLVDDWYQRTPHRLDDRAGRSVCAALSARYDTRHRRWLSAG